MSDTAPLARTSDPSSSHIANAKIAADATLAQHIEHAARSLLPQWFDDTDLLVLVERQTGRRQQRNVIARSRGLMERDGKFERVGLVQRSDRKTIHFCLPGEREARLFD